MPRLVQECVSSGIYVQRLLRSIVVEEVPIKVDLANNVCCPCGVLGA